MPPAALDATSLPGLPPPRRGKVRDVYDLGDRLLVVATDRISAFDVVLSPGIPGKGAILTQLSTLLVPEVRARSCRTTSSRPTPSAFPPALAAHAGPPRRAAPSS